MRTELKAGLITAVMIVVVLVGVVLVNRDKPLTGAALDARCKYLASQVYNAGPQASMDAAGDWASECGAR